MAMWLLLTLALVLIVLTFVWWRWRRLPPGPWGLPVVGYLPWINPTAPYETLSLLALKYGPIYSLSLGGVLTVVLTDPKDIRSALMKDSLSGRAPLYVTHGIMQGYGLICTEGKLWKNQRKFVHKCLRQFGAVKSESSPNRSNVEKLILEEASKLVEAIGNSAELDPLEHLRHAIGSVMNRLTFGKSWPKDDETWKWLQHLQEEGTKHIGVAGPLNFLPFLRFLPKYNKTMTFLLDGKHKTHQFYQKLITAEEKTMDEWGNPGNLIQAFLQERSQHADRPEEENFYCNQQFYHILADFFGAGLDTTLTTLRWYLLFMALDPQLQSDVRKEITDTDSHTSLQNMRDMHLTNASLAEAQRIRSVVPLGIPHGCLKDTDVNGFKISKNTMVVPLQWGVHMDPRFWENPQEFNPRRFLREGRFEKPDAFIPFQTGRRVCVGEDLANMMLFLFGVAVIRAFEVGVPKGTTVDLTGECGITLTPKPQKLVFTKKVLEGDEL